MQIETTSFQALDNVIKAIKNANRAGLFELEQSHLLAESLTVLSSIVHRTEELKSQSVTAEE